MNPREQKIMVTAQYLKSELPFLPEVAIILGSGLGPLADTITDPLIFEYKDIPNFAISTAPGHSGRLVVGDLGGKKVLAMQGRFHYYEGYEMSECIFPVQVFAALGIKRLIVTNAAGGIDKNFRPGELMLITDLLTGFCPSPMRGINVDILGKRFFDMTFTFDQDWQKVARHIAQEQNLKLREGTYAFMPGPHFETPADIRALRTLGADAVGMSTVPEIIAARHAGMSILGVSCITNMAAGILNIALSGDDVNETAAQVEEKFCRFITALVATI